MYIVRETFTAKPGMASKLAAVFKEALRVGHPSLPCRVLTDVIADFNTVVLETEAPQLADFERLMAEYMTNPEIKQAMKGYADMYLTGRREVYKVM